ncbi:hypothetical protein CsatB_017052 [Cannabis sativa]
MGASSSSAHENVSRVEFEELKKSLSVVVSQQGILMKSVAEMNKKLDILIEFFLFSVIPSWSYSQWISV